MLDHVEGAGQVEIEAAALVPVADAPLAQELAGPDRDGWRHEEGDDIRPFRVVEERLDGLEGIPRVSIALDLPHQFHGAILGGDVDPEVGAAGMALHPLADGAEGEAGQCPQALLESGDEVLEEALPGGGTGLRLWHANHLSFAVQQNWPDLLLMKGTGGPFTLRSSAPTNPSLPRIPAQPQRLPRHQRHLRPVLPAISGLQRPSGNPDVHLLRPSAPSSGR